MPAFMQASGKRKYMSLDDIGVELTWKDLDGLERAITHGQLPSTSEFFFGNKADDFYKEQDIEFIRKAQAELFLRLKVFYNSLW